MFKLALRAIRRLNIARRKMAVVARLPRKELVEAELPGFGTGAR
jgi:hypothetical protein